MTAGSFWPVTAQGWATLVTTLTGLVVGFAKWGVPMLRRTFGRAKGIDVRVKVKAVVAIRGSARRAALLIVVQNHSTAEVHLTSVKLRVRGGGGLWAPDEFMTGRLNAGGTLKAGDAYTFSFDAEQVLEMKADVRYAEVEDRIGRKFRSSRRETALALAELVTAEAGTSTIMSELIVG